MLYKNVVVLKITANGQVLPMVGN